MFRHTDGVTSNFKAAILQLQNKLQLSNTSSLYFIFHSGYIFFRAQHVYNGQLRRINAVCITGGKHKDRWEAALEMEGGRQGAGGGGGVKIAS